MRPDRLRPVSKKRLIHFEQILKADVCLNKKKTVVTSIQKQSN